MTTSNNNDFNPESVLTNNLDFDYWMELNKSSPEEFEAKRSQLMQAFIENAPQDHKRIGEGLLFKIDVIRRNQDTAMNNCIKLSGLMWDSALSMEPVLKYGVKEPDPKKTAHIYKLTPP